MLDRLSGRRPSQSHKIVYPVDGFRRRRFPGKRHSLPGKRPQYPFFILRSAFLSVDAFFGVFVYPVDDFLGSVFREDNFISR